MNSNLKKRVCVILAMAGLMIALAYPQDAGMNKEQGIHESFMRSDRVRSGIAIGGIGTGSVELRKDGQFYNWSIMNNWPLG
ncbi:MAG: hypothetical protein QNK35_08010, partial [Bacteroides sp.]|nr:hypothetical protein [Bacteroides sp.]